jgi:hypothetical protein
MRHRRRDLFTLASMKLPIGYQYNPQLIVQRHQFDNLIESRFRNVACL